MTEVHLPFINTEIYLWRNTGLNADGFAKISMNSPATFLPRHYRRKLGSLKTTSAIFDRQTTDMNFGGFLTQIVPFLCFFKR